LVLIDLHQGGKLERLDSKKVHKKTIPFLIQRATPRSDAQELPGAYCPKKRVWLIESSNGFIPLILSGNDLQEIQTKTFSGREKDDQPFFPLAVMTKTSAQLERDDSDFTLTAERLLLELATKTDGNNRERDD
jgi:hypothetical protein